MTRHVRLHDESEGKVMQVVDHVVEQRFSDLAQGILKLGTMAGPLLIVVHLIPQGVLAVLFLLWAYKHYTITALPRNSSFWPRITLSSHLPTPSGVWPFVIIERVGFGGTFAISRTIAAIAFPVIILLLVPVRASSHRRN